MRMRDGQSNLLICIWFILKEDRFLQFTISSGNKFQSPMVAGKKECLNVSVLQIGSLSHLND